MTEMDTADILAQVIQKQAKELEIEYENNYRQDETCVKLNERIHDLLQKLKDTEEKLRVATCLEGNTVRIQQLNDLSQQLSDWRARVLDLEKDAKFWKSCASSANHLNEELEKENKRLTERCKLLAAELKPYRETKLRNATTKIQMESAGRARC